jgi:hypothetical protein
VPQRWNACPRSTKRRDGVVESITDLHNDVFTVFLALDDGDRVSPDPKTVHPNDAQRPVKGCSQCGWGKKADEPGQPSSLKEELRGQTED